MKRIVTIMISSLVIGCGSTGPDENILEGSSFITVSPGEFQMGAPEEEEGSTPLERPVHTVSVNYTFEIMTTEVTQGMWEQVTGENPSTSGVQGDDYPVYNVSWNDCVEFCSTLNTLDNDYYYRLPTESEWEYCCRAGTETPYYWGSDPFMMFYHAWCNGTAGTSAHPTGQLSDNAFGLHDIAGNMY